MGNETIRRLTFEEIGKLFFSSWSKVRLFVPFAVGMDELFFKKGYGYGFGGSLKVGRLDLGPISFDSEKAYFALLAGTFTRNDLSTV